MKKKVTFLASLVSSSHIVKKSCQTVTFVRDVIFVLKFSPEAEILSQVQLQNNYNVVQYVQKSIEQKPQPNGINSKENIVTTI